MTRDIKEWFARWLQSILALNVLSFRHRLEGLPENIDDIPLVNVYETNEIQGDDWEHYLKDQGQAWIITPLHYTTTGLRIIRKASGGGTWDEKGKIYEDDSCCVRKYTFKVESKNKQQATNERIRLQKYTMIEYTPNEKKPKHAVCRITVVNKKNSTSQQPQQQQGTAGGTFENATTYSNQSNLEMCIAQFLQGEELSEFMKHFSKDDIVQVFSLMMDQIPAASPKEHSTEAAVRKPRKRGRCTSTNTMEEGTSTQRQEQAKVEILGLNATKEEPEFVNSPSRVNQNNGCQSNNSEHKQIFESNSSREKGEQSSHDSKYIGTSTGSGATSEQWVPDPSRPERPDKDTLEGQVSSCSTYHDASYKLDDRPLLETGGRLNQQMFESNSYLEKPTNLRSDTNRHCSDFGELSSHHGNCNEKNAEQGRNTSNFATTREPHTVEELLSLCNSDDMVEPNAAPQEPNHLSPNFNVSSTEPMDNQNRIAPNPSTSIFTTTEGRLDTSNPSTIVPGNIDSNNIFEGWIDLSTEDLHADCCDKSAPIWDWENLYIWDESKPNCWDW